MLLCLPMRAALALSGEKRLRRIKAQRNRANNSTWRLHSFFSKANCKILRLKHAFSLRQRRTQRHSAAPRQKGQACRSVRYTPPPPLHTPFPAVLPSPGIPPHISPSPNFTAGNHTAAFFSPHSFQNRKGENRTGTIHCSAVSKRSATASSHRGMSRCWGQCFVHFPQCRHALALAKRLA